MSANSCGIMVAPCLILSAMPMPLRRFPPTISPLYWPCSALMASKRSPLLTSYCGIACRWRNIRSKVGCKSAGRCNIWRSSASTSCVSSASLISITSGCLMPPTNTENKSPDTGARPSKHDAGNSTPNMRRFSHEGTSPPKALLRCPFTSPKPTLTCTTGA